MSRSGSVRARTGHIQNVFVFLLLAIFAIGCILMTAMAAEAYRSTVADSTRNNTDRVLSAVVRGAVRSEDAGTVVIERFEEEGITSLTFVNDYDGDIYYRRLYCSGGYLWESLTSADRGFSPDMGDTLCEASVFEPTLEGNLLTVLVASGNESPRSVCVSLRAGGAEQ